MSEYETQLVIAGGKGPNMFPHAKTIETWTNAELETPYGKPSGGISLLEWNGKRFFAFSRHGDEEQLPPHEIPYLANAYALKEKGVKYWLAVSLSTTLSEKIGVGDLVVPDTYFSHNTHRIDNFFSGETIKGLVLYMDNYETSVCGTLKDALAEAFKDSDVKAHLNVQHNPSEIIPSSRIIYAGMQGPETGTIADETALTNTFGEAALISGMTNMTEAKVAAQAGIGYASLSYIGGANLNYSGVGNAISKYLNGLDTDVAPILESFIRNGLPKAIDRKESDFFGMCTGAKQIMESEEQSLSHEQKHLKTILKVLIP